MARLIIDTSGYIAGMTRAHPLRAAIRETLAHAGEPPVFSPMVAAELDYLVLERAGPKAQTALLDELTGGAYDLATVTLDDARRARDLTVRYSDLRIGLTDAVTVVLADRYRTNEVLTLDERHFRAMVPLNSQYPAFRLLPMDR
jgi:uncharacterized protein